MKFKLNIYFKMLILALFITYIMSNVHAQPVEELDVSVGIGYDIRKSGDLVRYEVPINIYTFEGDDIISSTVRTGDAITVGETRQNRQLKSSMKFTLGYEKIYVFSKELAEYSLKDVADTLFHTASVNDSGLIMVFNGTPKNVFKLNIPGFSSSSDRLEGILRNIKNYNYFINRYELIDIFKKSNEEGKCLVMPYVELKNEDFEITGLCIFKNHKLAGILNIGDTRYFNILRESKVRGLITIYKDNGKYLDFYTKSSRKVICEKKGDKFKFTINVNCIGEITSNELDENILNDYNSKKHVQSELEGIIKENCLNIIDRLKREYRVDGLELGSYAAAKYGRNTGVDWNEVISNSEIDVNVNVKIVRLGRGEY